MASYSEILFGRVVLNNRLASYEQVADCLRNLQGRTLGEVLVAKGILSVEQARQAQRAQALAQFVRAEKIFARILVERRIVDAKHVRQAFNVQAQRQYKTRLATLLQERGLLQPGQLEVVVDEQLVRLAEETARIEEQGLEGALRDSGGEGFGEAQAPENLDSVRIKNAVGPRGLLDSPRATIPLRPAAVLDEQPPPHKRTMIMESAAHRLPAPKPQPADDPAGLIGTLVASRYKVLEKVGEGGMGTVYRAEHCLMEKVVALKVLNPELVSSATSLERFRREIRAASRFQHRHVIQIYDAGEGEGGIFYMAMEFAEGEDLEAILAREGALSLDRCLAFFRQTLEAVGEAHKKGIVHRDLKSGNLMVTRDKHGAQIVKIMDFGIAKIALDEGANEAGGGGLYRTQEGIVTGTPQYMSPEQASGETVDHRSDLYSLGVILFEMLTGQLPFRSDTPMGFLGKHIVEPPPRPSAVRPDLGIPAVLESITLRLLEKSPAARYQTANEVLAEIDARCTPEGLQASTSGSMAGVHVPLNPTIAARPIAHFDEPPAAGEAAPARKRPVLILGLAAAFLVILTLSTTIALLASQGSAVEEESLARARVLLSEERWEEASAIVEPFVDQDPQARELFDEAAAGRERAKELSAALAQVRHADELAASFRRGAAGRAVASEALKLYRDAQQWVKAPELEEKIKALEARLGPETGPRPTPSPPRVEPTPRESPRPTPAETPAPQESPADSPSPPPSPAPSRTPAGQGGLFAASHALMEGDLKGARRLLDEAAQGLPADNAELVRLQKYLEAETLAAGAEEDFATGREAAGIDKLKRALALHPREAARERLQVKLTQAEAKGEESGAVGEARRAAAALDPAAMRVALARIPNSVEAPDLELAARALDGFASEWRQAREALQTLEASGDPAEAARLSALLEGIKPRLDTFPHPELKVSLASDLAKDAAQAKALLELLRKRRESSKSEDLRRFEAALAQYRSEEPQAETAARAGARLGAAQDLQYAGAYRKREASAEDRAFVEAEVTRWRGRMQVWRELKLPEGHEMVRVEGGEWAQPDGTKRRLPPVFYVASHELTCAEWDEFVRAKRRPRPSDWPAAGRLEEPVRTISLRDAKAYVRWRNEGLERVEFVIPDEFMWERAARGQSGQSFPWGEDYEKWREGFAGVGTQRVRPVGAFKRDLNDLGLFDCVGNVAELTTSRAEGKLVVRGGSILSARKDASAGAQTLVASGNEVAGHIGLRLFAVEQKR